MVAGVRVAVWVTLALASCGVGAAPNAAAAAGAVVCRRIADGTLIQLGTGSSDDEAVGPTAPGASERKSTNGQYDPPVVNSKSIGEKAAGHSKGCPPGFEAVSSTATKSKEWDLEMTYSPDHFKPVVGGPNQGVMGEEEPSEVDEVASKNYGGQQRAKAVPNFEPDCDESGTPRAGASKTALAAQQGVGVGAAARVTMPGASKTSLMADDPPSSPGLAGKPLPSPSTHPSVSVSLDAADSLAGRPAYPSPLARPVNYEPSDGVMVNGTVETKPDARHEERAFPTADCDDDARVAKDLVGGVPVVAVAAPSTPNATRPPARRATPPGGAVAVLPAAVEAASEDEAAGLLLPDGEVDNFTLFVAERKQKKITAAQHEAAAREKAEQLRTFYRGALPSLDLQGLAYQDKLSPKPPPNEDTHVISDVPAVAHADSPNEAYLNVDTMPVLVTAKAHGMLVMPENERQQDADTPIAPKDCKKCPGHPDNTCSKHGVCKDGLCSCHYGYWGEDCSIRKCPGMESECDGHGVCVGGVCHCDAGYIGFDCSTVRPDCPAPAVGLPACSGPSHGTCDPDLGACECKPGFTGEDCSSIQCPGNPPCNNNGKCWYGKCVCELPFVGPDCSQRVCPGSPAPCSNRGVCLDGECKCRDRWSGPDCSVFGCGFGDNGMLCSGRGVCSSGVCLCDEGFGGDVCSSNRCPSVQSGVQCNGKGVCYDDGTNVTCRCESGWRGKACEVQECPRGGYGNTECSGRGTCPHSGRCECSSGWTGLACDEKACLPACGVHGKCVAGRCRCEAGWAGADCATEGCPDVDGAECGGHGDCRHGHCVCAGMWKGAACSTPACAGYMRSNWAAECGAHGVCESGRCLCDQGHHGEACELIECPVDASNVTCGAHGFCDDATGLCRCDPGYRGALCSVKGCPGTPQCSMHGVCDVDTGACICAAGFSGDACEVHSCPTGGSELECSGRGTCDRATGRCGCDDGFAGLGCQVANACPNDCSGHGACDVGATCRCVPGYSGADCSLLARPAADCPGDTVWDKCGPSRARTCANLDEDPVQDSCVPRCVCPGAKVWDPTGRACVDEPLCPVQPGAEINACGWPLAVAAPDPYSASVSIKAVPCARTQIQPDEFYGQCVCASRPLHVCYSTATPFALGPAGQTAERHVLVLTDAFLERPRSLEDHVAQTPHVDLGDGTPYQWQGGQIVGDVDLEPSEVRARFDLSYTVATYSPAHGRLYEENATISFATIACGSACPSAHGKVCGGHGLCQADGTCLCEAVYSGADCGETVASASEARAHPSIADPLLREADRQASKCEEVNGVACSGFGSCSAQTGSCVCEPGFQGLGCEVQAVRPACTGGSTWATCAQACTPLCGTDECQPTFGGDLAKRGQCVAKCTCPAAAPFWDGSLGQCVTLDGCPASPPFDGCGVSLRPRPSTAAVAVGPTGKANAVCNAPAPRCPSTTEDMPCSGNGKCTAGKCACFSNFQGADCSARVVRAPPSPSPAPTPDASASPAASGSPDASPSPAESPEADAPPSPTASASPPPSPTPAGSPSATASPSVSRSARARQDPCVANPCDANADCTASAGGERSCACHAGFEGTGESCTACAVAHATAYSAGCTASACEAGHTLAGGACTNEDECARASAPCDVDATCADTEGSYTCTCNPGFSGDGYTACDACTASHVAEYSAGCTIASCSPGYKLEGGACVACGVDGATSYDTGCTVAVCADGFELSGGACTAVAAASTDDTAAAAAAPAAAAGPADCSVAEGKICDPKLLKMIPMLMAQAPAELALKCTTLINCITGGQVGCDFCPCLKGLPYPLSAQHSMMLDSMGNCRPTEDYCNTLRCEYFICWQGQCDAAARNHRSHYGAHLAMRHASKSRSHAHALLAEADTQVEPPVAPASANAIVPSGGLSKPVSLVPGQTALVQVAAATAARDLVPVCGQQVINMAKTLLPRLASTDATMSSQCATVFDCVTSNEGLCELCACLQHVPNPIPSQFEAMASSILNCRPNDFFSESLMEAYERCQSGGAPPEAAVAAGGAAAAAAESETPSASPSPSTTHSPSSSPTPSNIPPAASLSSSPTVSASVPASVSAAPSASPSVSAAESESASPSSTAAAPAAGGDDEEQPANVDGPVEPSSSPSPSSPASASPLARHETAACRKGFAAADGTRTTMPPPAYVVEHPTAVAVAALGELQCAAGYAGAASASCATTGTFRLEGCTECAAGTASAMGAAECEPCEPGSVAGAEGSTACTLCTAGRYQPSYGQAVCMEAEAGSFVPEAGATRQTACPTGQTSMVAGASSCAARGPTTTPSLSGNGTKTPVCACIDTPLEVCWSFGYESLSEDPAPVAVGFNAYLANDLAQEVDIAVDSGLRSAGSETFARMVVPLEGTYTLRPYARFADGDQELLDGDEVYTFNAVSCRPEGTCPGTTADGQVCGGHGECVGSKCVCEPGWAQPSCTKPTRCPGTTAAKGACSGHGVCNLIACDCDKGWTGSACDIRDAPCEPDCANGGFCNRTGPVCDCDQQMGFRGKACTVPAEQYARRCVGRGGRECSGNGVCTAGGDGSFGCQCDKDWMGFNCGQRKCVGWPSHMCHGRGTCTTECGSEDDSATCRAVCKCDPGWQGDGCEVATCYSNPAGLLCNGRGECSEAGVCDCTAGWSGSQCELERCPGEPRECSGRGTCVGQGDGRACECEGSWRGVECSQRRCPENTAGLECGGRGECNVSTGLCRCNEGFDGPFCGVKQCPSANAMECSGRGSCIDGRCRCTSGWAGPGCDLADCPSLVAVGVTCSQHGSCDNGTCVCDAEFVGVECERRQCSSNSSGQVCSGHGHCDESGVCQCTPQWKGAACGAPVCPGTPEPCNGNGECVEGKCVCDPGFELEDCSGPTTPATRSGSAGAGAGAGAGTVGRGGPSAAQTARAQVCSKSLISMLETQGVAAGVDEANAQQRLSCRGPQVIPCFEEDTVDTPRTDCDMCPCALAFDWPMQPTQLSLLTTLGDCRPGPSYDLTIVDWMYQCHGDTAPTSVSRAAASKLTLAGQAANASSPTTDAANSTNGTNANGTITTTAATEPQRNPVCKGALVYQKCPIRPPPSCAKKARARKILRLAASSHRSSSQAAGASSSSFLQLRQDADEGDELDDEPDLADLDSLDDLDLDDLDIPATTAQNATGGETAAEPFEPEAPPVVSTPAPTPAIPTDPKCVPGCACPPGTVFDHLLRDCVRPDLCTGPLELPACDEDKCANGVCADNACECNPGWKGDACDQRTCPRSEAGVECDGHGACDSATGACQCLPGHTGRACRLRVCPGDCGGRGVCADGTCKCPAGLYGTRCQFHRCPTDAGGKPCGGAAHGSCNATTGDCACAPGMAGAACDRKLCALPASAPVHGMRNRTRKERVAAAREHACGTHGDCDEQAGKCRCARGWVGPACGRRACPMGCGGSTAPPLNAEGESLSTRGVCRRDGTCLCSPEWTGVACERSSSCEGGCTEHGECVGGVCRCVSGWTGRSCETAVCPADCSGRGACEDGVCVCDAGWLGLDCSRRLCDGGCGGKGACSEGGGGECACEEGWEGAECETAPACPGAPVCGGKGKGACDRPSGRCRCAPGLGGAACEVEAAEALRRVTGPKTAGSVAGYTPCQLPFAHRNVTFADCAPGGRAGSDGSWCKTAGGGWGVCAPRGTCAGTEGKECTGHGTCAEVPNMNGAVGAVVCNCDTGWDGAACELPLVRVVMDGPLAGAQCKLPFTFRGSQYTDCTAAHSTDGLERCLGNMSQLADPASPPSTAFGRCAPRGTCPGSPTGACSGHGVCGKYGRCACSVGYVGPTCTAHSLGPATLDPLQPSADVVDAATAASAAANGTELPSAAMRVRPTRGPNSVANAAAAEEAALEAARLAALAKVHASVQEALFDSLNGPEWANKSGWESRGRGGAGLCASHGVRCDGKSRVRGLDLRGNGLDGMLPDQLAMLANLTELDVRNNAIQGTVPSSLCGLSKLRKLVLRGNRFRGQLPECLRAVPSLLVADVSENLLAGDVLGWRVWSAQKATAAEEGDDLVAALLLQTGQGGEEDFVDEEKLQQLVSTLRGLSREELRQGFASVDLNKDGKVSKGELKTTLARLLPEFDLREADLAALIGLVDTDADGAASFEEVVNALHGAPSDEVDATNATNATNATAPANATADAGPVRQFRCKANCMPAGSPSAEMCPRRQSGCPVTAPLPRSE